MNDFICLKMKARTVRSLKKRDRTVLVLLKTVLHFIISAAS